MFYLKSHFSHFCFEINNMSNVLKSIVSIKIVAIFNHISYHSSLFQESVYSIFVHLPHGFFKNQRPRQSKPKNVLRTELLKKIEQKAPKNTSESRLCSWSI